VLILASSKFMDRRTALSKMGKVAIGAGAVVVAGAAAASLLSQPAPPVSQTSATTAVTSAMSAVPVTLDVAYSSAQGDYTHQALLLSLPQLQQKHPDENITLTESVQDYASFRTYLMTRMAAGDAPDLMWTDDIWMGEFATQGFLAPLPSEWATPQGPIPDLLPSFRDAMIWNGNLYGIWWDTDTRVFGYNKKFISNPPTTWDDLINLQKSLKAAGKPPIAFYATYGWDDTVNSAMYMNIPVDQLKAPGWGFFDVNSDGKLVPIFNKAPGLKAFQYLIDLKNAGATAILDKPDGVDADFLNEVYSAELIAGSWVYGGAVGAGWTRDQFESKVGYVVQPTPPGGHTASYGGGYCLSLPAGSKNKDLTKEWILLLLDSGLETQLGQKYSALFTRKTVLDNLIQTKAIPYADVIANQLQFTIPRPLIPQWDQVHRYWIDALQEALLGKKSPQNALDDAAQKVAIVLGD
jgi:multiple sugar transport system substrate-binding protein